MSNPTGNALAASAAGLVACSPEWLRELDRAESVSLTLPQLSVDTHHLFHAGMYVRTVMVPAGSLATGVLMKRATLLIVQGKAEFFVEDGKLLVDGYAVIPGSAGRKTAVLAVSDLWMTMVFPTAALTVEEAEAEFTDQVEMLVSRKSHGGTLVQTGE